MDTSVCLILIQILSFLSPSESYYAYTGEELRVVRTLGTSLGIQSFVFVRDHNYLQVLNELRDFRESNAFCAVINSYRLDEILKDAVRKVLFFGDRMILVTKEHLNFTDVMEKLSDLSTVTWVVFARSLTAVKHSFIPMNVDFFLVQITSSAIAINKAYSVKPGLNVSLENAGNFPRESPPDTFVLEAREINFEGEKLKMLYFSSKEDCKNESMNDVLNRMECFQQEVIQLASEKLNFRISKVECPERNYPYNYPNGTLSDFFEILRRKEADISSGSYVISHLRLASLDFVWPIFTTSSMMYVKFRSSEIDWETYVRPISSQVWKAIACWIVITGALILLFDECRSGTFKLELSLFPKLIKSVLSTLQVFCNQGVDNISQWYSDRTVFMLTYLLFVSLYQAYTGCLISSLTVAMPDIPFTDINGFFHDGTYKIMTVNKGFHNYFVKEAIRQMKMETRNLMIDSSLLPVHAQEGIALLCEANRLVYIEFRENIVQYDIPCEITELPRSMLHRSIGIGFPKHSPYRRIINQEVNLLRSTGILHRMRIYLLSYMKLEEKEISKEEYINVSIGHVFSIFFVWGMGIVMAVAVFLLEYLSFHLTKIRGRFKSRPNCKRR